MIESNSNGNIQNVNEQIQNEQNLFDINNISTTKVKKCIPQSEDDQNNAQNLQADTLKIEEEYDMVLLNKHVVSKQTFFRHIYYDLKYCHSILSLFYTQSLLNPYIVKLFIFSFGYTLNVTIGSIFYSNETIEQREIEVEINGSSSIDFLYSIKHEQMISIWSVIISAIILTILKTVTTIPDNICYELIRAIKTRQPVIVETAHKCFLFKIKNRIILFTVILAIFHLFCWYYIICFSAVYKNSFSGVLNVFLLGCFIQLLITQVLMSFVKVLLRWTAHEVGGILNKIYRFAFK